MRATPVGWLVAQDVSHVSETSLAEETAHARGPKRELALSWLQEVSSSLVSRGV